MGQPEAQFQGQGLLFQGGEGVQALADSPFGVVDGRQLARRARGTVSDGVTERLLAVAIRANYKRSLSG